MQGRFSSTYRYLKVNLVIPGAKVKEVGYEASLCRSRNTNADAAAGRIIPTLHEKGWQCVQKTLWTLKTDHIGEPGKGACVSGPLVSLRSSPCCDLTGGRTGTLAFPAAAARRIDAEVLRRLQHWGKHGGSTAIRPVRPSRIVDPLRLLPPGRTGRHPGCRPRSGRMPENQQSGLSG